MRVMPWRSVAQFADVCGLDRLSEAGPAATRFIFVGRGEQRLARYDVDVDARFLVIQIFAGSGALGAALLRYAILLGRKPEMASGVLRYFAIFHPRWRLS